jgi:hypothetical protein
MRLLYLLLLLVLLSERCFGNTMRRYNVGVLMASRLDSPFDLERCGPAIDIALKDVNEKFLKGHGVQLDKVQRR